MGSDLWKPCRFPHRRRCLLAAWLVATLFIVGRAVHVQILERSSWQARAQNQHQRSDTVPAPRGAIVDRNGVVLAASRERVRVSLAPAEVGDREHARRLLVDVLGTGVREAERLLASDDPWIDLRGRYSPSVRDELRGVHGFHFRRVMERFHPAGSLGSSVLGTVGFAGVDGGVEQIFDSILAGVPGREVVSRDARGNVIPAPPWTVEAPRPGGEVRLTLDLDLQEIARDAILTALAESGARGGDLVALDPHTGDILALVSVLEDRQALTAITAPYEPGSTLKPFTVAAVLDRDVARLSDTIDTGAGTWRVAGRTIHDVHARGRVTLAEALRYSSNVGVAKAAAGLTPGAHFEALRDFGFGVPTGVLLPGEAAGRLRRPTDWSGQSKVSLSIGYEIGVTPLQMAAAYASLANGGVLMQPRLVREARSPEGRVRRYEPQRVRQVVSRRVTRRIAHVLEEVVEDGTGTAARLASYRVAGKSGTSRAWSEGGYQPGDYFASFAGYFPADDPQVVIFVKLDRPQGSYYGGSTAAPVVRSVIEGILATGAGGIDPGILARARRAQEPRPGMAVRFAADRWSAMPTPTPPVPVGPAPDEVRVPDVRGLPVRVAARRLHAFGFRVRWESVGRIAGTVPAAGKAASAGDTILIVTRPVAPGP